MHFSSSFSSFSPISSLIVIIFSAHDRVPHTSVFVSLSVTFSDSAFEAVSSSADYDNKKRRRPCLTPLEKRAILGLRRTACVRNYTEHSARRYRHGRPPCHKRYVLHRSSSYFRVSGKTRRRIRHPDGPRRQVSP